MKRVIAVFLVGLSCFFLFACTSPAKEEEKVQAQTEDTEETEMTFSIDAMPEFKTKDMAGNEITNEIFSQADLTVINFWGTYCGPCINEMTELAKWENSMPENVQLIGIMIDVHSQESEEFELAEKIIEKTGVSYENLIITKEFDKLLEQLVGVPTTFFINKDGNIVADPIVGANVAGYKEFVEEYFHEGS